MHDLDSPLEPLRARVMIDARYIQPKASGIGRYTEHLIRELLQLDETLCLSLITHPSLPEPVRHERVRARPYDAPPNSLRTRWLMPRALDLRGVDLFHSPFNILPASLPVPAVFTLHDIMWLLDPSYCTDSWWRRLVLGQFYGRLIPRSVQQAAQVMTVSAHSKQAIERYFPDIQGRVHVTYNGLDPFFSPMSPEQAWQTLSAHVPRGQRFVLVVGQGSPYKNHDGALAAFLEAFAQDPATQDVKFVLIRRFSRGPAKRLKALMQQDRARGRVLALQYVSGQELRAFYSVAQAFLFPSLYEGFGLPALEAMACGAPVVTSDEGAPAEVCDQAALKAPPRDEAALARALRALVLDDTLRQAQRERGLLHAQTFTWARCARQVHAAYAAALGRRGL